MVFLATKKYNSKYLKSPTFDRFSPAWVKWSLLIALLYWTWKAGMVGVGTTEIGFFLIWFPLLFINGSTRKLAVGFSPFFIYVFVYNSLKILHLYNPFPIHNEGLYLLEKKFFGINVDGVRVTLCEYFASHLHPFLDIIAGGFYITWAPFPILFGLFLFFKGKRKLLFDFWLAFLIVNIFGFIIYVLLPAAPPWYYLKYGADIIQGLGGEPAGLARFDQLIGIDLYKNMYSQGTNTYGALPSMHAAFPMVLSYYGSKYGYKPLTTLFVISMLCIWFGAIYSSHHYIIDVLLGMTCGIIGIFLNERLVNSNFAAGYYSRIIEYLKP